MEAPEWQMTLDNMDSNAAHPQTKGAKANSGDASSMGGVDWRP